MKLKEILTLVRNDSISMNGLYKEFLEDIKGFKDDVKTMIKYGLIEIHELGENLEETICWITERGIQVIDALDPKEHPSKMKAHRVKGKDGRFQRNNKQSDNQSNTKNHPDRSDNDIYADGG